MRKAHRTHVSKNFPNPTKPMAHNKIMVMSKRTLRVFLALSLCTSIEPLSTTPSASGPQRRRENLDDAGDPLLSLNLKLDSLARNEDAPQAQELFQRISALHKEGYYEVHPDTVSFNSVLKAWRNHPEKALEFWEAHHFIKKDIRSYNTFLLSLANNGMYEDASTLLTQMQVVNAAVRPDIISFNTVVLAFANGGNAEAAEELVSQLICRSSTSNQEDQDPLSYTLTSYPPPKPNAITLSTIIMAWSRHEDATLGAQKASEWLYRHQSLDIAPSPHAFALTLQAYGRLNANMAAPKVLETLKWMEATDENASSYNTVYHVALSIVGKASGIEAAERVFARMDDPDTPSIARLIQVWGQHAKMNQNNPVEAKRCLTAILALYRRMKANSTSSLGHIACTTILNAIAETQQKNSGDLALEILRDFPDPPIEMYNACLKAIAHSNSVSKVQQAAELLEEMMNGGIAPEAITYNAVLKAAQTGYGPVSVRSRNLQIGWQAFQTLHKGQFDVSSLTYRRCLSMISRQGGPSYNSLAKHALRKCCENGCLNRHVLEAARFLLNDEDIMSVIGVEDVRNLPTDLTRNAL